LNRTLSRISRSQSFVRDRLLLSRVLSMVLTLAELFRVNQIPRLVILPLASIARLLIMTSMIALTLVTGS
jgi:hypothetical protein